MNRKVKIDRTALELDVIVVVFIHFSLHVKKGLERVT